MSNKTLTPADKTSSMYKLTKKEEKNHLLGNAITVTYQKATRGMEGFINEEDINYRKPADIIDKMEKRHKKFLYKFERLQRKLCQQSHNKAYKSRLK